MAAIVQSVVNIPCAFALCFFTLLYLRSLLSWRARAGGRPIPPGPKRLPLIGSLFSVPRWKPWIGFRDLTAQYGAITYLEALGQPMLVLGSPDVIFEFLEKRSANTSDRTLSPLIPLAGQGFNFAFMPYGQYWRRHRRAFWQHFNAAASENYRPVQQAYARDFLVKLLERPTQLKQIIRYNFSGAAMKVIYGADIVEDTDERIDIIDRAFLGLRELTVSAQALLEFLPTLGRLPSWVPGTGFVKTLTSSQEPNDHIVHTEFGITKSGVEEGAKSKSVVSELLSRIALSSQTEEMMLEDEQIAKNVAAVALEGQQHRLRI